MPETYLGVPAQHQFGARAATRVRGNLMRAIIDTGRHGIAVRGVDSGIHDVFIAAAGEPEANGLHQRALAAGVRLISPTSEEDVHALAGSLAALELDNRGRKGQLQDGEREQDSCGEHFGCLSILVSLS